MTVAAPDYYILLIIKNIYKQENRD